MEYEVKIDNFENYITKKKMIYIINIRSEQEIFKKLQNFYNIELYFNNTHKSIPSSLYSTTL